jgi:hypothetical protein
MMIDVIEMIEHEIRLGSRIRAVVVLVGGLGMAAMLSLLWATEPALPIRTSAAFAVMIGIGLTWAAYGVWVLTRRHPLYARDSVIAGRIATGFACLFLLIVPATLASRSVGTAVAGVVTGLVFLALAGGSWRMAVTRRRRLLGIRAELESHLGEVGPPT